PHRTTTRASRSAASPSRTSPSSAIIRALRAFSRWTVQRDPEDLAFPANIERFVHGKIRLQSSGFRLPERRREVLRRSLRPGARSLLSWQEHRLHHFTRKRCPLGLVDLGERELADQTVEGKARLLPERDHLRNEALRNDVAFDDPHHGLAELERERREHEI